MMSRRREEYEDRESFSPWVSYSDLYCGLLLVFVLLFFFVIYQYISATETNYADTEALQAELKAEQRAVLAIYKADMEDQEAEIQRKNEELDAHREEILNQQTALAIAMADLDDREAEIAVQEAQMTAQEDVLAVREKEIAAMSERLVDQESQLAEKEKQLTDQEALIQEKEQALAEQQALVQEKEATLEIQDMQLHEQKATILFQQQLLAEQTVQLEAVVGVRGQLIEALNDELRANDISLQADKATGAIVFDSTVLFEVDSTELSAAGEAFIRTFFPSYLNVLFSDEFSGYVAEIIVEGHTDDTGSYLYNLELSQQRALTVAEFCLSEENTFLSKETIDKLRSLITINGCSYRNPVYDEDGSIDPEKSRRVEIKFRLKDQEMIRMLESILNP